MKLNAGKFNEIAKLRQATRIVDYIYTTYG